MELDRAASELGQKKTKKRGRGVEEEEEENKTLAMRLIDAVVRKIATTHGMNAEDLERVKPGRMRREYLDDMTVVVAKLHTGPLKRESKEGGEDPSASSSSSAAPAKKARK